MLFRRLEASQRHQRHLWLHSPAGNALNEGVIAGHKHSADDALIGPGSRGLHHVLPEILTSQAGRIIDD